MSLTTTTQAAQPAPLTLPSNNPLVSMQNMLMVVAQSNVPLQQEMQRTMTEFQRFMENVQANMETVVQSNVQLRRELVGAESRLREVERIHQVENRAHQEVFNRLSAQLSETNNRLATLENGQTAMRSQLQTVNRPDLAAIRAHLGALESKIGVVATGVYTDMKAKSQQITELDQRVHDHYHIFNNQHSALKVEFGGLLNRFNRHTHEFHLPIPGSRTRSRYVTQLPLN